MGHWIGKGQGQRGLHGSLDREGPGTERSTWVIG